MSAPPISDTDNGSKCEQCFKKASRHMKGKKKKPKSFSSELAERNGFQPRCSLLYTHTSMDAKGRARGLCHAYCWLWRNHKTPRWLKGTSCDSWWVGKKNMEKKLLMKLFCISTRVPAPLSLLERLSQFRVLFLHVVQVFVFLQVVFPSGPHFVLQSGSSSLQLML